MTKFGDLAEIVKEAVKPADIGPDEKYVAYEHIAPGSLRIADFGSVEAVTSNKSRFRCGDVIYGRLRPYFRKVAFAKDFEGVCSSDFWVFRPHEEASARFVFYVASLEEFSDVATASSTGTRMPRASWEVMKNFEVPDFTISQQMGIANVLGALDDKIESNQRKISILADFTDTFAVHWSTGVELCRLGDLGVQSKVSVKPQKLGNSLVDHLSIPACDDQEIPERTEAQTVKSNKLSVSGRAVLVSRLNPRTYRSWFFTPDPQVPAMASTEFLVLQPLSGNDEDFAALWLAIRNPEFKEEMARRVTGTSGSHQRVRPSDAFEIMVPNYTHLSKDKKERVMGLLERKESLSRENTSLAILRDSLLPELLSGRLAPEDIPALINSGEVAHA